MKRFLRNNGLTLALASLTLVCLTAHFFAGHATYLEEQRREGGEVESSRLEYLTSGHFLESVFENWESEFLQMAAYVLLTAFLFQRGSSESKDPDGGSEDVDEDPHAHRCDPNAPGPVRAGGVRLALYEHSLTVALALLFVASFVLHALTGLRHLNEERASRGEMPVDLEHYVGGAQFWFESFQNWQSEFLSVAVLVVLSIYLRQIGSPESKPVHAPHRATGGS
jgi:hypothetical protein